MMKILIINPNSSPEMTEKIKETALDFAAGAFEVDCLPTPGAPDYIETYEDQLKAAPGMIRLVRENEKACDAFIVACHCDPNLDAIKEITTRLVVGIGEASMKIASMLGHNFSVVTDTIHSIPNKEALARKYHLQDAMASARAPERNSGGSSFEERIFRAAEAAVKEDHAEVLVLGCAGMTGLDKKLQQQLGVPVLDGVVCALIISWGLLRYGVSTSKSRRYNPLSE
jgi:allantoin racemase